MRRCLTRRGLLRRAGALGAAAAAIRFIPAPAVLADPAPGERLNLAMIGCGGRSLYLDVVNPQLGKQIRFVALVDPDEGSIKRSLRSLSDRSEKAGVKVFDPAQIKNFSDYRRMYDKLAKEIDAVLIATPDHQHACPAMTAIKLGKHVFCEKPLVHHISEARALGEAARRSNVVTQMGNQGSGTGNHQTLAEYLEAGAIGKLREAHAWHVFASRFGGSMPKPQPQPVPKGLDWDAWLGPATERPFSSVYRPWHGWCDFGTGSLGGWGTHVMDAICFALKLGYPKQVELIEVDDTSDDRFPRRSTVRYDFPEHGTLAPISVFWYEGAKPNRNPGEKTPEGKTAPHRPPLADQIEKQYGQKLGGAGNIFVGEKGMIYCGSHGAPPILFPPSLRKEFTPPPKKLPRPSGGIMGDFVSACRQGGRKTFSAFDTFAGPFLEMLLVGHLAMRAGLNKPVQWDGTAMKCTNMPELDRYVDRPYRQGWTLD